LPRAHAHGTSLELTGGFTTVNKIPGWPSFVTLKDGSILTARGHMWCRSADGGRSWAEQEEWLACPEVRGGIRSIIRLNSGKLGAILIRVGGLPALCRDSEHFRQMWLWFTTSDDEGRTWSTPVQMNRYFTFGQPHVTTLIQTKSGRLALPVRAGFTASDATRAKAGAYGGVDGERRRVGGHTTYPEMDITFCYLSDDGGRTWRKSSGYIFGWDPKLGSFPCDEPVVIELKDSRLMLLARSTIGQLYRVHSSDGGDNWDIAEPSGITSAYAPCMIRRIPTTGDLLLI